MQTSPEPTSERLREDALNRLKGMENPFESLVRPQKNDVRFRDLDVPTLLSEPRQELLQVIDWYRVEDYTGASDLRPTRVVIVRGARGSGKTHLLRSIQYRDKDQSQILVRPSFYEVSLPFEEYLCSQLVGVLLEEDEVYAGKPFEDIARALTRRLLAQAVQGLSPTDRLFACSPGRWQRFALLWGRGARLTERFDDLAQDLANPAAAEDLPAVVQNRGLTPAQCLRVIEGHLRRHERGKDPRTTIRLRLYLAMGRLALLHEEKALRRFLEGEYVEPGMPPSLRFDTVSQLLHVLTEACALERFPIVVAFDNLERLFSPQNRFDGGLTQSFLNSLAQAVDNTRGLLLLLFAESGMFDSLVVPHMDAFARDRLSQGVPLRGRGPVELIDLKPPALDALLTLTRSRIKHQLVKEIPEAGRLPDEFPFSSGFLTNLSGSGTTNLRAAMLGMRNEFSRVVYGRVSVTEDADAREGDRLGQWQSTFATAWKSALAAAARKLDESKVGHAQSLHAGLGKLLRQVMPLERGDWELKGLQPVTIGEHPTYGLITLLDWQAVAGKGTANGAAPARRVGVGLLLAGGPGMAPDLRAKFGLFRDRSLKANSLIVLWPRAQEVENVIEALPPATRDAWKESSQRSRTRLEWLSGEDLCAILAFPDWVSRVGEASDGAVPADAIRQFVLAQCERIIQLIQPPEPAQAERTAASED